MEVIEYRACAACARLPVIHIMQAFRAASHSCGARMAACDDHKARAQAGSLSRGRTRAGTQALPRACQPMDRLRTQSVDACACCAGRAWKGDSTSGVEPARNLMPHRRHARALSRSAASVSERASAASGARRARNSGRQRSRRSSRLRAHHARGAVSGRLEGKAVLPGVQGGFLHTLLVARAPPRRAEQRGTTPRQT